MDTQLIVCRRCRALALGMMLVLSQMQPCVAQTPSKETAGGLTKPSQPLSGSIEARDQGNEIFKTASQAQLRACAFQWRDMKRNGKAAGKIWRDFARACLSGL